ncbi:MAG: hypothetical protein QOI97_4376, partial [Pseudomonas sp.]|nr:hypothetical protein [Pseudomonas sp.]
MWERACFRMRWASETSADRYTPFASKPA